MKKALLVLLAVVFVAASAFADFRQDEKPVSMIHADTAYTLSQNEWTIDLYGPVTYGILDNLQIGTNFYVWFLQAPNVFVKWNILTEDETLPALSLGGLFGTISGSGKITDPYTFITEEYKVTMMLYNVSAYVTKRLSDQFYVNGSYSYNSINITMEGAGESWDLAKILDQALGITNSTGISIASIGGIYELSSTARLMVESIGYFYQTNSTFVVSPGFEWALGDTFRLKLAVTAWLGSTTFYAPYISLKWRIK